MSSAALALTQEDEEEGGSSRTLESRMRSSLTIRMNIPVMHLLESRMGKKGMRGS